MNAFPTAASFFRRALAHWPADDPDRPALLLELADALYMANDPGAADALVEARDVLLAAGDRDRAALAEHALGRLAWHRGSGEEARDHDRRAAEFAEGGDPAITARILATIARTATIGGLHDEGSRIAIGILERLGDEGSLETRAHVLATIGLAKAYTGDLSGIDDERRALELAIEAHSPIAGSIANNVAVLALQERGVAEADRLFAEGLPIAERFGDHAGAAWIRRQRGGMAFWLGRWDEALVVSEEVIAEAEAGNPVYHESTMRNYRAQVREGRGDIEGALADRRAAVARGRETMDPQELGPALGGAIASFEMHGLLDEAKTLAEELVTIALDSPVEGSWSVTGEFAFTRLFGAMADRLRPMLDHPGLWGWGGVVGACIESDFVAAAEAWVGLGSPSVEARARFRAAEVALEEGRRADAEEQMGKALEFFRGVGATFWIERGEALLSGRT